MEEAVELWFRLQRTEVEVQSGSGGLLRKMEGEKAS